jgi:hypothetical protein
MTATLTEFDQLVAQMTAMSIPRDKAEAAARKQLGIVPKSQLEQIRDDALVAELEDDVVDAGDRMMQSLGFTVIRLSQKRASKVTAGIPDRRYYHTRRRLKVWWEAKSATGKQRPDQRQFQMLCDATNDPYVLGGIEPLRAWLVDNQVASFDESGLHHPIPYDNA